MPLLEPMDRTKSDVDALPFEQSANIEKAKAVAAALHLRRSLIQVLTCEADRKLDIAFVAPASRDQRESVASDQDFVRSPENSAQERIERHQTIRQITQPFTPALSNRAAFPKLARDPLSA